MVCTGLLITQQNPQTPCQLPLHQSPVLREEGASQPCARRLPRQVLELAEDEERAVRCAAICALGGMLRLLPPEPRRARAFPFLRALCTAADVGADAQRCAARLFGGQLMQVRRQKRRSCQRHR